ncbi:hypothetical protein [Thiohalobacter thiocyanaticus]|uniref:Uncharacterized protein n=1 Tax=Thiohalobacter thiocyanaticus TaxID=585455 RepID=A0A426QG25_9GAMM|nr:hypothetical protein [Thiohalobacter thiocyanaticus]RRQ20698.1 hypothetical protein D6C00_00995 [Thiohalobacter thiocyanaticus]
MSELRSLSDLIDLARGDTIQPALLRDIADGRAQLSHEQRERVRTLNRYSAESIESLLQGLNGLAAMLCHASPGSEYGPTQQDYADCVSLVAILSGLIRTLYLLESETAAVLAQEASPD